MWLPTKVYELLPWAYVAIGILFFAGVVYIGERGLGTVAYFVLGAICVVAGMSVRGLRANSRTDAAGSNSSDDTATS